jgi:hypothetical protein
MLPHGKGCVHELSASATGLAMISATPIVNAQVEMSPAESVDTSPKRKEEVSGSELLIE